MNPVLAKLSPNAADMIRADHARVLTTFHRYKTGAAPAEFFHPAMGSIDTPLVGRLVPEHDKMRNLIGALRGLDADSPQYDATVMELMREVMHHVAEEETVLLPEAERVLGEKARAMPKANLLLAAGAILGAAPLYRGYRRHA